MFDHSDDIGVASRPGQRRVRNRKAERRLAWRTWLAGVAVVIAASGAAWLAGLPGMQAAMLLVVMGALWMIVADRFMRDPGGVPVLTWHSVSRDARWLPWADQTSVTPETLDRQLSLLGRMRLRAMDSCEFVVLRRAGRPIPPDAVILHFDDGYLDNWVAAAPILQRHGMRATVFVSLDFIAPDGPLRPSIAQTDDPPDWRGYMSWREIAALDAGAFGGAFGVEAHGVDHARIETGERVVTHLSETNWRRLAWVQWAKTPGDKHDWFRHDRPWAVPMGSPVRESDGALAARGWTPTGRESAASYEARVRQDLRACQLTFAQKLGRPARLFCWPQNLTSPRARDIAAEEGYLATTGGSGANRPDEDAETISRVHVGERVAGFAWPWADDLALRASIRSLQGNHYWYLPLVALGGLRAFARRIRPQRGVR